MTGEEFSFAMDRIFDSGAVDISFTNIQMKKNRPGVLLTVLGRQKDKKNIIKAILKHTTTIGIRMVEMERVEMERNIIKKSTKDGVIRVKKSKYENIVKEKIEFDDLCRIALENDSSIIAGNVE